VGSVNTVLRVPSSEKWYEFKPTRNIMDAPKTKFPPKRSFQTDYGTMTEE
jgi:hypothetical protein